MSDESERDKWYSETVGSVPAWSDTVTDTPARRELARLLASGELDCLTIPLFTPLPTFNLPPMSIPTIKLPDVESDT